MREICRIADVNFNRAREGLRVVEEACRFVLADPGLTARIKELRHRLSALEEAFPGGRLALLAARDIPGDVGAPAPENRPRDNIFAAAGAGWKRAQEAARVLEELSREADPAPARHFKEFRFALYAAEREWTLTSAAWGRKAAFDRVRLYLVAGRADTGGRPLVEVVRAAVAGGAGAFQLREKNMETRELTALAAELCAVVRSAGALFLVNDRADVAAAVDADGVHLGQDDLPVEAARRLLGLGKLIGVSVHSPAQAREAWEQGADYVGLGAVFPTATKPEARAVSLSRLSELAAGVDLPSVAIGGIDLSNIKEVLRAGFRRVAVVRAVAGAPDPNLAAAALCEAINEVWGDH
ncbi:MAG: thiamine phosphate synthase [Bacillota bacterium]